MTTDDPSASCSRVENATERAWSVAAARFGEARLVSKPRSTV
jgi:hypothetical protein